MYTKYLQIATLGIATGILLVLIFRKEPKPIINNYPAKNIVNRIEGKETVIKTIEKRVGNEKKIIDQLTMRFDEMELMLKQSKERLDTFEIVRIQDTLISTLKIQNKSLLNIVNGQDSIIVAQRYIINSKDTLISIAKLESKAFEKNAKKMKRQRNGSLILNAILAGALILK